MSVAQRLRQTIQNAGVAITDVSIGIMGQSASIVVIPETLQSAAQPTINTFDWSQAAHDIWSNSEQRIAAKKRYDNTVTNTEEAKLLRAIVAVLLDEINTLRTHAAIGLPARTLAQAKTGIQNKIDAGAVD